MFAIFEPTIIPRVILGSFSIAEVIETKSSGNEVPTAKIIAERAKRPVFVCLAILLMATITRSADLTRINENRISNSINPGTILVFL
jgi:hypothetical protein